ncbi:hypothetical protein KPP03845_106740 [Streptomyces xanthophaeus]|nr:hypothetical protein KPP03845_106740 [Streptomyces xanthophaeus]
MAGDFVLGSSGWAAPGACRRASLARAWCPASSRGARACRLQRWPADRAVPGRAACCGGLQPGLRLDGVCSRVAGRCAALGRRSVLLTGAATRRTRKVPPQPEPPGAWAGGEWPGRPDVPAAARADFGRGSAWAGAPPGPATAGAATRYGCAARLGAGLDGPPPPPPPQPDRPGPGPGLGVWGGWGRDGPGPLPGGGGRGRVPAVGVRGGWSGGAGGPGAGVGLPGLRCAATASGAGPGGVPRRGRPPRVWPVPPPTAVRRPSRRPRRRT